VKLGKEFCKERQVPSRDREDAQPSKIFWSANDRPGYLALAAVTGFLPGPEESTTPLIEGLNGTNREDRAHGMGDHGREDRINKDQASTDGERAPVPAREAHITFGDDGGKINKLKFVGGKRKTKVGVEG
jgi:hypothetical protein